MIGRRADHANNTLIPFPYIVVFFTTNKDCPTIPRYFSDE